MLLKRKNPFLFMEKGIMTESRTQSILEELAREAAARLPHPSALNIQVSGLKIIRREESNRLIDCVPPPLWGSSSKAGRLPACSAPILPTVRVRPS